MKKILLGGIVATFAFALSASVTLAAPKEKCTTIQSGTLKDTAGNLIGVGYDQWGYNYQAHMFNGLYDNYNRPNVVATEGDELMMKWNDAWMSNQDCNGDKLLDRHYGYSSYIGSGAWLTNHASGIYEGNWNVVGTWKWLVLGTYEHDLVITSQDADGNFEATGGYPAGSFPYTSSDQTLEIIANGKVTGNIITFKTTYSGPYNPGYSVTVTGIINPNGTITGTGPWEWHSTLGNATKETCEWSDFVKIVAVPEGATTQLALDECPSVYGLDGEMWYANNGTEMGCSIWGSFAVIQDVYKDPCGQKEYTQSYHSPYTSGLGNWQNR